MNRHLLALGLWALLILGFATPAFAADEEDDEFVAAKEGSPALLEEGATPPALEPEPTPGATMRDDGFNIFLTTNVKNRYGGNIMLKGGHHKPGELGEFFSEFDSANGRSILPPSDARVEVVVVVPKGAPQSERNRFIARITDEVKKKYPHMRLAIHESFVDVDADRKVLEEQKSLLLEASAATPDTHPDEARIQDALELVDQGLKENQEFKRSWFTPTGFVANTNAKINSSHPYNTIVAAKAVALLKFGIAGSVIVSKYGLNVSSAGIGALAGVIAAAFGYNAKRWSQWCTAHKFPFFQDFAPVRFYNRNGWFKSASINLFRSLGISYVLRSLAYWTNQTVLNSATGEREAVDTANSWEFWVGGLGLSVPEILLDGLFDDASRALEVKNIMNHQSRSYLLWLIGFVDSTMHALFRANATKGAYMVAGVSISIKLSTWAAGKFLPAGPPRFVFVHDSIRTEPTHTLQWENRDSFLKFVATLIPAMVEAIKLRTQGKFTVSDEEMVRWQESLDELWNVSPKPEEMDRIQNDPHLTQAEFEKILNLGDSERAIRNALWKERNRHFGKGDISMPQLCADALINAA